MDLAERRALGSEVAIEIRAYDECHTVLPIRGSIRRIKDAMPARLPRRRAIRTSSRAR